MINYKIIVMVIVCFLGFTLGRFIGMSLETDYVEQHYLKKELIYSIQPRSRVFTPDNYFYIQNETDTVFVKYEPIQLLND